MPQFKSTVDILKTPCHDEVFSENWMDRNDVFIPPNKPWDYKRELKIEDIDIWEVLYQAGGGIGIFASWDPYAEFYMVTTPNDIETYYGADASKKVFNRAKSLGINLPIFKNWVEDTDTWLYKS